MLFRNQISSHFRSLSTMSRDKRVRKLARKAQKGTGSRRRDRMRTDLRAKGKVYSAMLAGVTDHPFSTEAHMEFNLRRAFCVHEA